MYRVSPKMKLVSWASLIAVHEYLFMEKIVVLLFFILYTNSKQIYSTIIRGDRPRVLRQHLLARIPPNLHTDERCLSSCFNWVSNWFQVHRVWWLRDGERLLSNATAGIIVSNQTLILQVSETKKHVL